MSTGEPRPRVLVVITLAEMGGAQRYVATLVPLLGEHYDVAVAAHGDGYLREATEAAGVRFIPLEHVRRPIAPREDLRGLRELVRLLRAARPDVVHVNSSKAAVLGRLAAPLAGVRVRVFTVHGWAFKAHSGLLARAYLWADRLMRPLTTTTICVAESERAAGLAAGTCAASSTVVIPNAVGLDVPRAQPGARAPLRVLAVGRLREPKDFVTLVRAAARLEASAVAVRIAGDGPDRPALEAEIARLGVGDRVELLGERADVPELLAAADAFVLPSLSEGMPISVLEAMAAGLPVVASDVGGVGELVRDGETGALVAAGDSAALADALARLASDPAAPARQGQAGRRRVETEFSPAAFRAAHLAAYDAALAGRRSRR